MNKFQRFNPTDSFFILGFFSDYINQYGTIRFNEGSSIQKLEYILRGLTKSFFSQCILNMPLRDGFDDFRHVAMKTYTQVFFLAY